MAVTLHFNVHTQSSNREESMMKLGFQAFRSSFSMSRWTKPVQIFRALRRFFSPDPCGAAPTT